MSRSIAHRLLLLVVIASLLPGCSAPAQQIVVVTATPAPASGSTLGSGQVPVVETAGPVAPATATATPLQKAPPTSAPPTAAPPTVPAAVAPTSTPTRAQPTATPTLRPSTATATPTRTTAPTRTPTPTPEPATRVLYSKYLLNAGKVPNPFGDKGDILVYSGERMPAGCVMFKVMGLEYSRLGKPVSAPQESTSDTGHGWSVARQNDDPRDYGVKIHWWYNVGSFVSLRIYYVVRQPWNVDCLVADKMLESP